MEQQRAAREGFFYVLQLVPDLRPERVKFGWTTSLAKRLPSYVMGAPTFTVAGAWSCLAAWEAVAIKAVTGKGDRRLSREAFDVADLRVTLERTAAFFEERGRAAVPLTVEARGGVALTPEKRRVLASALMTERWPAHCPVPWATGAPIALLEHLETMMTFTPPTARPRPPVLPLRQIRRAQQMTSRALAIAAGIHPVTMLRIEEGKTKTRPHPGTCLAIANALGVSMHDIRELANGDDGPDEAASP